MSEPLRFLDRRSRQMEAARSAPVSVLPSNLERRTSNAARSAPVSVLSSNVERRTSNAARSAAFTLIELVTVIGIMALMIVIAIPAFTNKASAPRVGASDVANLLALVRQKAVSSRNHTAVIFSWDAATTNDTIQARVSYAPVMCTNESVWIYLDRWSHLPKGAFFSNAPSSSVSCAFPTNGGTAAPFSYAVEFNSKGEAVSSSNVFTISEGVMMPGSLSPPSNAKYANSVSGVVYRLTGAVRIPR